MTPEIMPSSHPVMQLNDDYDFALYQLESGRGNLFITGRAGTGKSTLLREFASRKPGRFALVAPTGIAALTVGGETIHSFFKFRPNITVEDARILGEKHLHNWLYTKLETLIIDEISMVRADLLDAMDIFLRTARESNKPFGNVRVIFFGDLYQLPPVLTTEDEPHFYQVYNSPYFFSADVMTHPNFSLDRIELKRIYRQQEPEFIALLNAVRHNRITPQQLQTLNARVAPIDITKDGYIHLTTTNRKADWINTSRLERLPGKARCFPARISGNFDHKNAPADLELYVKPGAQIMFLTNHWGGCWYNGSLGHVLEIEEDFITVETTEGHIESLEPWTWDMYRYFFDTNRRTLAQQPVGSFTQFPIKLAWAMTIHKSQGKTLEHVILDPGAYAFAHGQMYVALSRCRNLDDLILKVPIHHQHIIIDPRIDEYHRFNADHRY